MYSQYTLSIDTDSADDEEILSGKGKRIGEDKFLETRKRKITAD